jgi:hypothetical protein
MNMRFPVNNDRALCFAASGSGSVIGRDPLPPRAVSAISLQQQIKDTAPPAIILTTEEKSREHITSNQLARKLSPSSGSASHCPVPSSPHSSSNVERSDTPDGKGKKVNILFVLLNYAASDELFSAALMWSRITIYMLIYETVEPVVCFHTFPFGKTELVE